MALVSMKELLEAGVHFGHQTRRWNPKMKRYIYGERDGIYIVDLHQSLRRLEQAYNAVRDVVGNGGTLLFVGTKRQAQESIQQAAERCGQYFVNQRWLGGMLTNFETMRGRVKRLHELYQMEEMGVLSRFTKKEEARFREERFDLFDGAERVHGGGELVERLRVAGAIALQQATTGPQHAADLAKVGEGLIPEGEQDLWLDAPSPPGRKAGASRAQPRMPRHLP